MGVGLLYLAIFMLAIVASRVSTIGHRGDIPRSAFFSLVDFLSMAVTFSLFVWGFASLAWYWPIAAFLVGSVLAGVLVTLHNWPRWFNVLPALELVVIAGGVLLWIWHWPF